MTDTDNPANDPATRPRPVVLCILDGWGDRAETADNAIALGDTPNWDRFRGSLPFSHLQTAGSHVGLPDGQMGNSEVGHTNIGAGRVVMQDLPRIDAAFADGSVASAPLMGNFIDSLKQSGGTCHLMGLLSPGGVHSHQGQIAGLAKIVADAGIPVAIHAFLDGRDTPPRGAGGYMADFLKSIDGLAGVSVATVCGRYYAMDRDQRWDRVELAYRLLVDGVGGVAADANSAIMASYATDTNDEFVMPTAIDGYSGMKDGDGLLMANFRADRARELLCALADPTFDGFERGRQVVFPARLGLVEYSTHINGFFDVLFASPVLENILGEVVADAGLSQLRIAETEKYAHVTFFFNGGREAEFPGEERILVPSPKVATYDLQPEMSAPEVTDRLVEAIESGRFDLVIVNYANGDMVGHTGMLDAAIAATGAVDAGLGRLEAAVIKAGGTLLVTADHGNCEMMRDAETGDPHTAHTTGAVPLAMVNAPDWVDGITDGRLADVAPTLLRLLALDRPDDMTGRSLLIETPAARAAV